VLPVTVWHQPRQRRHVRKQLQLLRARFGVPVDPLIMKTAMKWSSIPPPLREETGQRCRCFLFASLGAITAVMHGQRVVEVFESGIGAINLPLMTGMVGAMATRNAHPKFLRLMSRLAGLVTDGEVEFRLPFFDKTNGEVTRSLVEARLEELTELTRSCVDHPLRYSPHTHCGVCPACVFRRQAIAVAGIVEPEGTYKYDIFGAPDDANRIPAKCLQSLKAFM